MKISARNKLEGTICAVHSGPVSTEVVLDLAGGDKLVAVVTSESATKLGLAKGKKAVGLIKAPLVTLLTDAGGYKFALGPGDEGDQRGGQQRGLDEAVGRKRSLGSRDQRSCDRTAIGGRQVSCCAHQSQPCDYRRRCLNVK